MQPTSSFHSLIKKYTMKNIYILFLLYLFSINSFAQNDWASPGAVWYYELGDGMHNGFVRLDYTGDTLIQGVNCKKLKSIQYWQNIMSLQIDTFCCITNYTYTDSNRIFYFIKDTFHVLYDFNLIANDIWEVPEYQPLHPYCDSTGFIRVLNVGQEIIFSDTLNMLNVEPDTGSNWGIYGRIVERIGALDFYMFPQAIACVVDNWYGGALRCYYDSAFGLYQAGTTPCDFIVGIDESITGNGIKVFPNPACSFIQVEKDSKRTMTLEIFSITGQLVFSKNVSDQTNIISVQHLDADIYFLRLSDTEKVIHTERLVVE